MAYDFQAPPGNQKEGNGTEHYRPGSLAAWREVQKREGQVFQFCEASQGIQKTRRRGVADQYFAVPGKVEEVGQPKELQGGEPACVSVLFLGDGTTGAAVLEHAQ